MASTTMLPLPMMRMIVDHETQAPLPKISISHDLSESKVGGDHDHDHDRLRSRPCVLVWLIAAAYLVVSQQDCAHNIFRVHQKANKLNKTTFNVRTPSRDG